MNWFLPPGEDFSGEGGVVTISATEAGLQDEFEQFLERNPDPLRNPMALNIPYRQFMRGRPVDSQPEHKRLYCNLEHIRLQQTADGSILVEQKQIDITQFPHPTLTHRVFSIRRRN